MDIFDLIFLLVIAEALGANFTTGQMWYIVPCVVISGASGIFSLLTRNWG